MPRASAGGLAHTEKNIDKIRENSEKKADGEGFEAPASARVSAVFKTADDTAQHQDTQQFTKSTVGNVADCVALLREESPDLAHVLEAWPTLPDEVKQRILAMVRSATSA